MIASPVLILGARSDIARALARSYAAKGAEVILAGRGDMEIERKDLEIRADRPVRAVPFDVTAGDPDKFFVDLGEVPGTVVMVVGLLGDQDQSERDDAAAAQVMDTNYTGPARYLLAAARVMQDRKHGCIIGISSVAGDRGRGSNFIYGSAKAGFTAFLSGLRNRFAKTGLHVMTVKPGFVATQMTAHLELPGPLTAQPDDVAQAILKAQEKGRDEIYVLGLWRLIMMIIRAIPERIFKKLSL